MIPTVTDCYAYMAQYGMLENIRAHSLLVARVAVLLTKGLQQAGNSVSLEIIIAGALLHDIAKTSCLNIEEDHAVKGRDICRAQGMPEIAEIVAQHVILQKNGSSKITEIEVVYYADKRVNHDEVVSLEERRTYILERYAGNNESLHQAIMLNFERCKRLEAGIFAQLDFAPSQVADLVDPHLFA